MNSQELALAEIRSLTPCQQDVAILIAKGMNQAEVAAAMGRSVNTVKLHRYNAFKRLGITKSTQLAVICTLAGLVTDWEAA